MTHSPSRTTAFLVVACLGVPAGYCVHGADVSVTQQFVELAAPGVSEPARAPRLSIAPPTLMTPPSFDEHMDNTTLTLADVGATTGPGSMGDAAPAGGADDAAALAKKLANPLASMISVPFQYNADFNGGVSGHAHRSYLNVQPVIPVDLNQEWNLITRTIIPVVYQEEMAPGQATNWGLGDTTASFWFSPKAPLNGWIWGVGPVAYLPTGTDTALGTGQWGAGPTVVALRQENGWTVGMLANHIWSIGGDSGRPDINATFMQPFLAYTFPTATTITLNTESTYDWGGHQWTVPINLMVSQMVKVGGSPMSFQFGPRYYVEGPSTAAEWGVRFVITFLFPK